MAKPILSCECCIVQGDIRYCATRHTYTYIPENRELDSVSKIVSTVYSTKSWDGVDPEVIRNANERGTAVDQYMAAYVRTGDIVIPGSERRDVAERVLIAHRLWAETYEDATIQAESQKILFNLDDGAAGMADFAITYPDQSVRIVDLKCTYSTETSWLLQIGAYATYSGAGFADILHVSPAVYKKTGGGRIIPYDVPFCKGLWADAIAWWKRMNDAGKNGRKNGQKNHA